MIEPAACLDKLESPKKKTKTTSGTKNPSPVSISDFFPYPHFIIDINIDYLRRTLRKVYNFGVLRMKILSFYFVSSDEDF